MTSSWMVANWRTLWPGVGGHIALVLAAAACGIVVGLERQRHEKPAGLRTLMMVCVGSAVFTLVSFAFVTTTGDSGRVAAQIVTGIGFLGAGVILHGRRFVSGMTTAAIIWVTAAIGITVGAGYGGAGLALSVLIVLLLRAVTLYEHRYVSDMREVEIEAGYEPRAGLTRVRLERVLVDYHIPSRCARWIETAEEGTLHLHVHLPRVRLQEMLGEAADVPGIVSISQQPPTSIRP